MTCACGHEDDEHVDGFRECNVAIGELVDRDDGPHVFTTDCPCFLFEADEPTPTDNDARRTA